jgi:hypothetical protein
MADITLSQNIEQLLQEWIEAERNGIRFPVPLDAAPSTGFFLAMLALSKLNEASRQVSIGDNGSFCKLFQKVHEVEKWRRDFAMPSKHHHDILIEMCDAINVSIVHSQGIELPMPPNGHIYFLLDAEASLVKIGWSTNWRQRTGSITAAHPRKLTVIKLISAESQKEETDFHRRYKKYRVNGEWFELTGKLKEFLGNAAVGRQSLPRDLLPELDALAQSGVRQAYIGE